MPYNCICASHIGTDPYRNGLDSGLFAMIVISTCCAEPVCYFPIVCVDLGTEKCGKPVPSEPYSVHRLVI